MYRFVAGLALLSTACVAQAPFRCRSQSDCVTDAAPSSTCEDNGACSSANGNEAQGCGTRRIFSNSAASSIASRCVAPDLIGGTFQFGIDFGLLDDTAPTLFGRTWLSESSATKDPEVALALSTLAADEVVTHPKLRTNRPRPNPLPGDGDVQDMLGTVVSTARDQTSGLQLPAGLRIRFPKVPAGNYQLWLYSTELSTQGEVELLAKVLEQSGTPTDPNGPAMIPRHSMNVEYTGGQAPKSLIGLEVEAWRAWGPIHAVVTDDNGLELRILPVGAFAVGIQLSGLELFSWSPTAAPSP